MLPHVLKYLMRVGPDENVNCKMHQAGLKQIRQADASFLKDSSNTCNLDEGYRYPLSIATHDSVHSQTPTCVLEIAGKF